MASCAGQQTTVYLPWRQFVPVKRARVDPNTAPLDPSKARQFGLVLSRFEFNGLPNPNYKAGRFSLKVLIFTQRQHLLQVTAAMI